MIIRLLFILLPSIIVGQSLPKEYYFYTKQADSLFKASNYKQSALAYSQAFKSFGWKGRQEDRYSAARSWALAGYPDSAIFNIERLAIKIAYTDYNRITTEKDFTSLQNNKHWQQVIEKIKFNKDSIEAREANMNKPLIALLDSLAKEDQRWRNLYTKFSRNEISLDSLHGFSKNGGGMILTDYLNYIEVRKIFSTYGFPNYDLVGVKGSHNFWLIVQHQDYHPSFQDSVLTAMKIEAEKGKASWKDYAYLIDRVKVNTKQFQIYGTQMNSTKDGTSYEPKPVIEPEKLNERRKSVGLSPEEDYIKLMERTYHGSINKN
jgi:hypothetical protein